MTTTKILGGVDYWAPGNSSFTSNDPYQNWILPADPSYPQAYVGNRVSVATGAVTAGKNALVPDSGGTSGSQPGATFTRNDLPPTTGRAKGRVVVQRKITSVATDTSNGTHIFGCWIGQFSAFPMHPGHTLPKRGLMTTNVSPPLRANFDFTPLIGTVATFRLEWYGNVIQFFINDVAVSWNEVLTTTPTFTETPVGTSVAVELPVSGPIEGATGTGVSFGNMASVTDTFTWPVGDWYIEEDVVDPPSIAPPDEETAPSNLHVWSNVALPDPKTYYGGYKEPRVVEFGTIRRSLSDDLGEYEGTSFTFVLDDSDRKLRRMLDDVNTRYFPNRAVVVRTITDELRRQQGVPRTVMRGMVGRYRPAPELKFEFTITDSLAALFSGSTDNQQIPKRLITLGDFPNCPQAAGSGAGAPVKSFTTPHPSIPIPPCPGYVQISDQAQIANMTGRISNGKYSQSWAAFWDEGPPAHDEPAGNSCQDRGWIMYSRTADGTSGQAAVPTSIGEGWGGHAPPQDGDVTFASPDVAQALEEAAGGTTTDMVCLSLPVPIIYGTITDMNLAAGDAGQGQAPVLYVGAYTLSNGVLYHKFVVAGHACKLIDGIYGCNGAQGVGTYPASNVGDLAVQAGVGGDWVVPGYGNWTAIMGPNRYEDINGKRYTTIYGKVGNLAADVGSGFKEALTDESIRLSVSVHGIETIGDGTGTLITNLLDQYLHCIQNWVLGDYQTGAWKDSPVYSDEATLTTIDDASFGMAKSVAERRVIGGYRGDFIIGSASPGTAAVDNLGVTERVSVRELVKRFNQSADVQSGFNHLGQFFVSMIDDSDYNVTSIAVITDATHVHKDTFDVVDDQDHHWNVIPFRHTKDYFLREKDGWRSVQGGDQEVWDDHSIQRYGPAGTPLKLKAPTTFMHMLRGINRSTDYPGYAQGAATAKDVAGRFLMRHRDPPRLATFQLGWMGLNTDLGDMIRMTHYAGVGTGGWVNRPLRVLRHEASPGEYTVDFTCLDLQNIFSTGFILGDENVLPHLWTDADEAERFYGYLGDETTGTFTDGQPMKRVR